MNLGMIFSEATTEQLLAIAHYAEQDPRDLLVDAIDRLYVSMTKELQCQTPPRR